MSRYIIQASNGQYWTGETWGVKEAAQTYTWGDLMYVFGDSMAAYEEHDRVSYYDGDTIEPCAASQEV